MSKYPDETARIRALEQQLADEVDAERHDDEARDEPEHERDDFARESLATPVAAPRAEQRIPQDRAPLSTDATGHNTAP